MTQEVVEWQCFHCKDNFDSYPEAWNTFKNIPDSSGISSTLYVCDGCLEEEANVK